MLQAGRLRVRFPMRLLDFLYLPNPSSRTMTLGSTQPLTEMSKDKGLPACKVDNLTAVSRLSRKCGSLDVSQPYRPLRPVTGIAFTTKNENRIQTDASSRQSELRESCDPDRSEVIAHMQGS
jgi:hypothetical protein